MRIREIKVYPDGLSVREYHSLRYGAPGQKRQTRSKPTLEAVKKNNLRRKAEGIRDLLRVNFVPGDYWITLTYRKGDRPESMDEAKTIAKNFRERMKKYFRKAGVDFKWIQKTEVGSRGAVHHHFVINRIPGLDKALQKEWKHGIVRLQLLYSDGRFRELADYIAKEESAEHAYTHSRNLQKPKVIREILSGTFKPLRQIFMGFTLDKSSVIEGVNMYGFPYRVAEYTRFGDG